MFVRKSSHQWREGTLYVRVSVPLNLCLHKYQLFIYGNDSSLPAVFVRGEFDKKEI